MCSVFKVSRSGFYRWLKSGPSKRSIENELIECEMMQIFEKSKKTYGSPRITIELNKNNIKVSRPRIARMMQKAKLRSIVKKDLKSPLTPNINFRYQKIYWTVILNGGIGIGLGI